MQGVVVKEKTVGRAVDKSALIAVLIGVAVVVVVASAVFIKYVLLDKFAFSMIAFVAAFSMVMYAITMWKDYKNTWPEYIVSVEDSVCLNEFMEKYEIVDEYEDGAYKVVER